MHTTEGNTTIDSKPRWWSRLWRRLTRPTAKQLAWLASLEDLNATMADRTAEFVEARDALLLALDSGVDFKDLEPLLDNMRSAQRRYSEDVNAKLERLKSHDKARRA